MPNCYTADTKRAFYTELFEDKPNSLQGSSSICPCPATSWIFADFAIRSIRLIARKGREKSHQPLVAMRM
jgi:hypothetical protein